MQKINLLRFRAERYSKLTCYLAAPVRVWRCDCASFVVWCTGFLPGLEWIRLPIFDGSGRPKQYRGMVPGEPGLYFPGLAFQHAASSAMIHGVGRDARRVVEAIVQRLPAPTLDIS